MRVGLDLDNCGYPLADEAQQYFSRRLGVELQRETVWDSHKEHWGLSGNMYHDIFDEGVADGELFANAPAIPGYSKATWDLSLEGHRIVIATARRDTRDIRRITAKWLNDNLVNYDELLFTNDKSEAECDIFIDDKPSTIPSLLLNGVDAVYYDQPWNEKFPYKRVHSWPEFTEYVRSSNV